MNRASAALLVVGLVLVYGVTVRVLRSTDSPPTTSSTLTSSAAATSSSSQAASAPAAPRKAAKAVVDEQVHNFGAMNPAEDGEHVFIIRNVGDAPLHLTRGPTSCKCTLSKLNRTVVPPGESGEIRVTWFTESKPGPFVHEATVWTNDPDRRGISVRVQGMVRTFLSADPVRIEFAALGPDEVRTRSVAVYSQVWDELELVQVQPSLPGFTWKSEPLTPGELAELKAHSGCRLQITNPDDLRIGRFEGSLLIEARNAAAPRTGTPASGHEDPHESIKLQMNMAGNVLGRISVSGDSLDEGVIDLGVTHQGEGARCNLSMVVRGQYQDLGIRTIETTPEFLVARLEPLSVGNAKASAYRLHVEVPADAPVCSYLGDPVGRIRIVMDHAELPVVKLKVRFAVLARQQILP